MGLKKLKEKQAKRKEIRAEQEKKLNQQKKEEEEKLRKEENEKKAKEAEEKKKRLEEAEAKRQEMLEAQKAGAGADKKKSAAGGAGGDARREMSKTKEQLEEEKKIALSIRLKPLELDAMDSDELKAKATEIFNIIIQLETDKYDYEQRKLTQELDLKELKERQKGQRDQQRSFLSGSVRGQARKLEMLRPLRVRKMVVRKHLQKKKITMKRKKRRRKKKKKKSKHYSQKTSDL